jgi:DNA-binding beta-propeller fold protein YncE
LTAIDLQDRQARQIPLRHELPHDVRVSRDGRHAWVAVAPSRAVIEIDTTTGALTRTFGIERDGGWFVAATPDDRKLYVPHLEGRALTAIDRETGTARAVLSGTAFSGAEVSPDGREVWAIEHEARRIHVLSTSTDTEVASIALDAPDFGRLQFSPDGRRVFVVQGSRLTAFDGASRQKTAKLTMARAGKVIAVAPSGHRAAISNPQDGKVTIIDLERMQVLSSFTVGKTPDGVAWVK